MVRLLILCLLTCGPLVLTLAAWVKLYWTRQGQWPRPVALIALSVVSLNAALAAGLFVYYHFEPSSPSLPPWQDPEILNFGLLFLLAPIGMVIGFIAAARGAPKWLICVLEIASVPLFVVGLLASAAV
jgi:hypothetical protein